ncbi:MAG: basic amino acid ABC transporter substrate-binding protein [Lachnospiraceae bacterium]|nr:basic amino acid ABC transporter substrate-binding protein [Lachnospiraceae bacterium]
MKKVMAMLLATVLCVATFTACGSEETGSKGTGTAPESTVSESTQAGSEAEGDAASVETITAGVLTVGTNAAFPPFEYIGDDGEPAGFDIALIKAIGEKMGMEVKVQDMEFGSLVAAIGNKIDVAIAGMTITEERKESVDFSDSYYEAVQYVIVLPDSDIATAADLENKSIGVQLGTTGEIIAEDITGANVQSYDKAVDAVSDLINGRVQAVIIDKNPAEVFASKFEGKVVALDGAQFAFEPEQYAIALPKGSPLAEKVNAALAELKADGTFDALVQEYIVAE